MVECRTHLVLEPSIEPLTAASRFTDAVGRLFVQLETTIITLRQHALDSSVPDLLLQAKYPARLCPCVGDRPELSLSPHGFENLSFFVNHLL
jgi:hypothetical protein